ncbi:MAG TPA: rhomboid family intramembrane serine protease [Pseudobdellovibrionaceae bacterium]|nr:rhomboid family intramembrane serine protease [Pseudobdellovibrionaceae bacterium]
MIFPLLRGLLWFHRAPMTWLLVAVNIGVFAWTYPAYEMADENIQELVEDSDFVHTHGMLYAMALSEVADQQQGVGEARTPATATQVLHPHRSVLQLAERARRGDPVARRYLGIIALRDGEFMKVAKTRLTWPGDQVAIEAWREQLARLVTLQERHPSFRLGLSAERHGPLAWFSYQIAHSGGLHLFWNMLFLLLFGTFVENGRGSRAVFCITWVGGLAGALAYVAISGLSASPLVGASAAVSALIGVVAGHFRRRLPFVYWLLPFRGYYGVAWLPAWILVPVFLLPDLSGWLASQPGISQVAYTAHLGGALAGYLLSFVFPERSGAYSELAESLTGTAASSSRWAA